MSTAGVSYFGHIDATQVAPWLIERKQASPQGGILALVAEANKAQIPVLQQLCRETDIPLAGAIFPALLHDKTFAPQGVWLLPLPHPPLIHLIANLHMLDIPPAAHIAAAITPHLQNAGSKKTTTLFMIFDSMVPNIASILDDLYLHLADRVHYMGVNAGSETFQPMPCLFDASHMVGNGVLCLLLEDHPGATLEHGYVAPDTILTATATIGNRIISIDWRPAFEVYQEMIRNRYGVALTQGNFYEYATHYPLGILLANNDVLVRIPVAVQEDGSVFCVGEIPANAILTLLEAPKPGGTASAVRVAQGLASTCADTCQDAILAFYCAGRRMHLGSAAREELSVLQSLLKGHRFAGALSLGEIGSISRTYPLFHNATLICSPWQNV